MFLLFIVVNESHTFHTRHIGPVGKVLSAENKWCSHMSFVEM